MTVRKTQNSNLFSIDHDAILAVLEDANKRLIDRSRDLIAALDRVPDNLYTDDNIKRAELFMRQINEAIQEIRLARLADSRPFTSATKIVKDFFEEIDKPLRAALAVIKRRLTDATLRGRFVADPAVRPTSVGIDIGGNEIITVNTPPASGAGISLALDWEVDSFDRRLLDLEVLRPFLTDAALLAACNKHLVMHGPNKLRGVTYKEIIRGR